VTISTTNASSAAGGNSVAGVSGSGDITVAVGGDIKKTAGGDATLTLQADRNITINAPITVDTTQTSSKLNITLSAANNAISATGGVDVNANLSSNGGNILIGGAGGNLTTATNYGIGYAINKYVTSGAAPGVVVEGGKTIDSGGGKITINGVTNTTSTDFGVSILSKASITSEAGNIYISGLSLNSGSNGNKAIGVNIADGGSGGVTTLATTTGLLQIDGSNAVGSSYAVSLTSTGGWNTLQLNAPSVAYLRVSANGSVQASTFNPGSCTSAANYATCGQIYVPTANGSNKYGQYNVTYSGTIPLYVTWTDSSKTYDGTTTASSVNYSLVSPSTIPNDFSPTFTTSSRNAGGYTVLSSSITGSFNSSNGTTYALGYFPRERTPSKPNL